MRRTEAARNQCYTKYIDNFNCPHIRNFALIWPTVFATLQANNHKCCFGDSGDSISIVLCVPSLVLRI